MDNILSKLKAAGELTRLRLLCLLSKGELNVTELTQILGQSQPRISRHLKLLGDAGLVERFREGSWVFFRLADGDGGDIARKIIDFVPKTDTDIAKDAERYDHIREKSAAIANVYFSNNAANWDEIRSYHVDEREVEKAIIDMVGTYRFNRLVDLGTGTGRMLELLSKRYDTGLGIDANIDMLNYARARLEKLGINNAQVRQGDILNLSTDKGTADAVILHQVLHYLDDPALALREAARIATDNAHILIVDFASHDLDFLRDQHAHKRLGFEDKKIEEWAKKAGLLVAKGYKLRKEKTKDKQALTVCLWLLKKNKNTKIEGDNDTK